MSYNHQSIFNNNNNNSNDTGDVSSALNQDVMTNDDFPLDFDPFNSNFLKTTTNSNNSNNNNVVLPYFSSENASSLAFLANDLIDEVNKTEFGIDLNSTDYAGLSKNNEKEDTDDDDDDDDNNNEEDVVHSTLNLEISSETSSKKANTLKKTKTAAKKSKEPSLKRKRKDECKEENETKNETKKKSKSQYQRRNIKKIITETKLNESTLKALQEEQERQMRLNKDLNTSQLPSFNTNNTNISLFISNENGIKNEPYVNNLSTPNLETNDSNLKVETTANSEMLTTFKEESKCSNLNLNNTNDSSDQSICIIEEDSFTPKRKNSNLNNSSYQQQQRSEIEDLTTNDDDDVIIEEIDNSDDCVIISESDHQQEEQSIKKRMLRGMHMNDDLNVPDQNGQVLVNVNHPPEDIDIYLNAFISRNIKSHQIGGIRFMYDNIVESLTRIKDKSVGFGCILAHAMGLGKTLQIVSFVEIFLRCTCAKRVLCIVPINTIQNWLNEFNYWLPENGQQKLDNDTIINYRRPFKVHLINDFSKTHKQRAEIIIEWTNNGGVLLIGYEMFRTLVTLKSNGSYTPPKPNNPNKKTSKKVQLIDLDEEDQLLKNQSIVEEALLTPCLVVCDEGHRIKNSAANIAKTLQRIKTKRRIVLTGYPLQNNLIEYWCMVDFVRPSYLGTKAEFSNMFERPITNGQCMDSTREDVKLMRYRAHVLHSLLEGFVQRRGHDVFFCSLPKKFEYIILLKLSTVQKELYLAFMESIGAMKPGEKINPLRSFAICCKIWNHPDVLHKFNCDKESEIDLDLPELQVKKTKSNQNNATTVTINPIYEESVGGFNPFGPASYYDARNKSGLDPDWANRIMDRYVPNVLENGAKFLLSFSIIEESVLAGDKILLFSQSLLSLNLIEEYLQRLNVPNTNQKWEKYKTYYRLDGSTTGVERERLINLFNKPKNTAWLFLLSTRAGCLGINLIGANRVIVLDASWNPCHDAQAVCRIYRYGQQKNCFIYRLIADHTMEKKIYDRQVSKQTMSDRVVDEIQTENHFTRTEVEKLIHYVKEDMPSADLSQMAYKYEDTVLVKSCMRNSNYITKEPFTHESLLIDKKEYKLSEREKQLAHREYEHDKKYFPYARQSYNNTLTNVNYAHLLNQNYPVNLSRSPSNNFIPLPNGYYTGHNSIGDTNAGYGKNVFSRILSDNSQAFNENKNLDFNLQRSFSSGSLTNNNVGNGNYNNNSSHVSYNKSFQNPAIMKCLNGSLNQPNNSPSANIPSSSIDFVINKNYNNELSTITNGTNGQQFVQQPSQQPPFNSQLPASSSSSSSNLNSVPLSAQKLSDVKISCFVAPTEIVIPSEVPQFAQKSSDDPTLSHSNDKNKIVIQPGEKVYILKTPKGCYLRTQDKKYIALRNKSLEDSFMLGNASQNLSEKNQQTTSFSSNYQINFEQTPCFNPYTLEQPNNTNTAPSQSHAQLDFSSNMLSSQADSLPMSSNGSSIMNSSVTNNMLQYDDTNLDFNLDINSNAHNDYCSSSNQSNFQNGSSIALSSSSYQACQNISEFPLLTADNFQNQMQMINGTSQIEPQLP